MPRKFTITTPSETVRLDGGKGTINFTLTNTSGVPQRVLLRATPLGNTQAAWLAVQQPERDFPSGGAGQVPVAVTVPPGSPPGRYPFRLDVVSAQRSGEDYEEGPTVTIETAAAAPPKKSRWWIWAALAALLLIAGVVAWIASRPEPASEDVKVADTGGTTEKPKVETVPLKLFWGAERGDNYTTGTRDGEAAALAAGYAFAREEGYVFPTEQPGTVPLKSFWSGERGDNYTTATSEGEKAALDAGYVFVRVEGYVYPKEQPDTVALKSFWNGEREDNFTTGTADGEASALAAGYGFVRVEGYAFKSGGAR